LHQRVPTGLDFPNVTDKIGPFLGNIQNASQCLANAHHFVSLPAARFDAYWFSFHESNGIGRTNHIPDHILAQLLQSLLHDKSRGEAHGKSESEKLRTRLAQVRRRAEHAYLDKLDGKITEVFWAAKSSEWNQEEQQILMALDGLKQQSPEKLLDGARILELANKAYFLYLRQPPAEKAQLLRIVLSNCKIDAASVEPTYRKPFDLIFRRVKNEGWLPGLDSN
jgi:hypothetical protein